MICETPPIGWRWGTLRHHDPSLGPEPAAPDAGEIEKEYAGNLFRHAGTVLFGAPIFGPTDPINIQPAPTPVPSRIGLADVKQVVVTTERLGQLSGDLGGIPMTNALTAHARSSEALLGAAPREPVRQQLLAAVSYAHMTAGANAAGAGLRDLARELTALRNAA